MTNDSHRIDSQAWQNHIMRAGTHYANARRTSQIPAKHREHIEPWLSALFQAEHLNLLVGSGLTTAIC